MNFPKEKLKRILFLDIETATISESYECLSPRLKDLWEKKSKAYLESRGRPNSVQEISDHFDQKAAIFAEFSRVICISVGFLDSDQPDAQFRVTSFYNENEEHLLKAFSSLLNKYYFDSFNHFLCGHNIKEFDVPFLCRRLIINQMPFPNLLNITGHKPWQVHHLLDTMDLWKFGDYKNYTSLDTLCAVLKIESPKNNISGKDVNQYYWSNKLLEIVEYCESDVIATAQVYLKCNGLKIFESSRTIKVNRAEEE